MSNYNRQYRPHQSFFWPIMLIGAGAIWLLVNLGVIPSENLWILLRLWPVLIIMAGLDVLFSRRLPLVGVLLALALVAGVVLVLLRGDELNINDRPEIRTETFEVPLGNTTSATFVLDLSVEEVWLFPLENSNNLIEAEIRHYGDVDFTVSGGEAKQISLERTGFRGWFSWFIPDVDDEVLAGWRIGLSPNVPFNLFVDASVGRSELDLSGIRLDQFEFDGGTGASRVVLPGSETGYEARFDGSTGALEIVLPEQSNLTLRLDGSTGRMILSVPENVALQVEVQRGGTGDLIRPDWVQRVSGREGRDEGIYQTAGFDESQFHIFVIVENISTGNIVIE